MGATVETSKLEAHSYEVLPQRDRSFLCPKSSLPRVASSFLILGVSMFSFANVSREDEVLEGALRGPGSGNSEI